jgi:hypothetical protein
MMAMTARLMPASMRLCRQGGVRPWWLHGSRVTTAVAPAASGPAAARAWASACASPLRS